MAIAQRTIEFDLDKNKELDYLSNSILKRNVSIGKAPLHVKFLSNREINSSLYAGLLLLFSDYLFNLFKSPDKKQLSSFNSRLHEEYVKHPDIKILESQIENTYNIKIEFEKKNPLDEVFGIWKNEDISLEKIREKAWRHNK